MLFSADEICTDLKKKKEKRQENIKEKYRKEQWRWSEVENN